MYLKTDVISRGKDGVLTVSGDPFNALCVCGATNPTIHPAMDSLGQLRLLPGPCHGHALSTKSSCSGKLGVDITSEAEYQFCQPLLRMTAN